VLAKAAQQEFKKQRCSFLVFDFLLTEQLRYQGWPQGYEPLTVSEPGTYMPIEWDSFETYLKSRNKTERQYIKENLKVSEDNGLVLSRHRDVPDIETALKLIENVSIWNGSAPNPWMRGLLTNFSMLDGTWLQIHKDGNLVGCGAVVRDNRFQLTTALGLEDDVPGGYFLLLYAALQEAFEQNARLVRFGSGAYDVKRMLGLHLEDTNHAMATIAGITSRKSSKLKTPS
jgi:hypothetical protein